MKKLIIAIIVVVSTILFGVYALPPIIAENATTTETVTKDVIIPYNTESTYDNTLREGVTKTVQEGKNGKGTATYVYTKKGGKIQKKTTTDETVIEAPITEKIVIGTKKYYTCSNGKEYDTVAAKDECEKRVAWEEMKNKALKECRADSSKFNCWFDNYPGTYVHWSYYTYSTPSYNVPSYNVPSYTPSVSPSFRTGAICRDGWRSSATGRGACSHHGGVSYWL